MSTGARLTIGIATLFSTFGFIIFGAKLGNDLPAGPTPLYIFAAVCGVIALACLVRRRQQQPSTAPPQEISSTDVEGAESGMNLDLSRLTLSGWLLFLSSIGIAFAAFALGDFILTELFPEVVEGRRMRKVVGGAGFFAAAGFFIGGKVILKKLGIPILRSNKDNAR